MTDGGRGDERNPPVSDARLERVATWVEQTLLKNIEPEAREMLEDVQTAVAELQRRRHVAASHAELSVLHVDGEYTPQQLLVALQDIVDGVSDLVVMIGWDQHPEEGGKAGWQLAMTSTPRALAYFALGIGMDKIMGMARAAKRIERDEDLEPLGD